MHTVRVEPLGEFREIVTDGTPLPAADHGQTGPVVGRKQVATATVEQTRDGKKHTTPIKFTKNGNHWKIDEFAL